MLVAEEFQDGWMRGLRLRDLQVKRAWHKGVGLKLRARHTQFARDITIAICLANTAEYYWATDNNIAS